MNYTFDSVAEDKTESIFVGDVNNLFVSTKRVEKFFQFCLMIPYELFSTLMLKR